MSGKFWTAGIVVGVVYFLLGWLFYGLVFASVFMMEGMPGMRTVPIYWLIFLASLAYGLLMAYTWPIGYKGGGATGEGVRFGILFALIVNLPSMLFMGAFFEHASLGTSVLSLVWELIAGAILGIITAKIYGGAAKAAA